MTCHACHRIFVGLITCRTGEDVYLRIVGHHALVHTIKGQSVAFGAPECTFSDTELIAMHALSVNYLPAAVLTQLVLNALTVNYIKLIVFNIGSGARYRIPVVSCLS